MGIKREQHLCRGAIGTIAGSAGKRTRRPRLTPGGHTPRRPACRPRAGALRKDPAGALAGSTAAQSPGFAAALLDGSGVRLPAGVAGVTPRARWGRRKVRYPGPPGAGATRGAERGGRGPWGRGGGGGVRPREEASPFQKALRG